ncbi:hypothetical protein LMJ63_25515, partial [Escherichia coli]|nr:hypothetical protein [Escherichia coli]
DFNSYGSRRGNHEVMMRGTFANIRIRNEMVPGVEGGYTRHIPSQQQLSIYDAAMQYQQEKVPLAVIAGKEYGSGSSRDWAAKGPRLLGVRVFRQLHALSLRFHLERQTGGLSLSIERGTQAVATVLS